MALHPTVRILVSLLAFGLLFGAGQAVASGEETGDGTTVVMPSIHLGDTMQYSLVRTYDEGSNSTAEVLFDWIPGSPLRMPDGTEAETEEFRLSLDTQAGDLRQTGHATWIYGRGSDRLLAEGQDGAYLMEGDGLGLPLLASQDSLVGDLQTVSFVDQALPPCYFGGHWADKLLAVGDALDLPACSGYLDHADDRTFHVVGAEVLDDVPVLRLQSSTGATVWLADGLPYPLAMQEPRPMPRDDGGWVTYDLRLTGWARGDAGRGPPAQPVVVSPAPPAVQTSAPTRLFVDETGVDLPFTLLDALYGPTGLGSSPVVAKFLLDNPTAFAVMADCKTSRIQDMDDLDCWIHLQDSDSGLMLAASKLLPAGTTRSAAATVPARVQTWDSIVWPNVQLPTAAPRVLDLVAKHQWHGAGEFHDYGYNLLFGHVWVGEDRRTQSVGVDPPALTGQFLLRWNTAAFDFEGRTLGLTRIDLQSDGRTEPDPALSPASPFPERKGLVLATLAPWPATAGISMAAAAASLLVWLALGLKSSPLFGLFSRLREDELAEHPMRRRILDAVAAQPGIHLKELGRVTGMPNGTLMHHSRRLADAGLVTVRKGNGYSCYFLGQAQAQAHGSAVALKSEGARKVLSAIAHRPNLSALDVERQTGLSPATVHHHLRRLTEAGLVRQQRNGRSLSLEATWAAKSLLVA